MVIVTSLTENLVLVFSESFYNSKNHLIYTDLL